MSDTITEVLENKILSHNDFDQFLKTNEENMAELSLAEYLEILLKKYHITKKDIISRTMISLVYGYQIFSGIKKKPARDYLLQIAFAFPLTITETNHLLYYGSSSSLYSRAKRDAYIMFALHNKYSLSKVNEYLYENHLEPFQEFD